MKEAVIVWMGKEMGLNADLWSGNNIAIVLGGLGL